MSNQLWLEIIPIAMPGNFQHPANSLPIVPEPKHENEEKQVSWAHALSTVVSTGSRLAVRGGLAPCYWRKGGELVRCKLQQCRREGSG